MLNINSNKLLNYHQCMELPNTIINRNDNKFHDEAMEFLNQIDSLNINPVIPFYTKARLTNIKRKRHFRHIRTISPINKSNDTNEEIIKDITKLTTNTNNKKNKHTSSSKKEKPRKTSIKRKAIPLNQPLIVPNKIFGEKEDLDLPKKGGWFILAGEACIEIEDGVFTKAASISSLIIPPNKRQDFLIDIDYQESMLSEIFVIYSKSIPKKPFRLLIPSIYTEPLGPPPKVPSSPGASYRFTASRRQDMKNREYRRIEKRFQINKNEKVPDLYKYCSLLTCTRDNMKWNVVPRSGVNWNINGAVFSTSEWGMFVIIKKQPYDYLNFDVNGGLYYSPADPLFLMRVPKFAAIREHEYYIQVFNVEEKILQQMANCYPSELSNVLHVSNFFSFTNNSHVFGFYSNIVFNRPITLRMTLPQWAKEIQESKSKESLNDLLVYIKKNSHWEALNTNIFFTRDCFSFDTRILGTFCLVQPRAHREGKVKGSMHRIEHICRIKTGVVLIFLWVEPKCWYLWIELVTDKNLNNVRQSRESAGLIFIQQFTKVNEEKANKKKYTSLKLSKKPQSKSAALCSRLIELIDGTVFSINLTGVLQIKSTSYYPPLVSKQFYKALQSTLKRQTIQAQPPTITTKKSSMYENTEKDVPNDDLDFLSKIGTQKPKSGTSIQSSILKREVIIPEKDENNEEVSTADENEMIRLVYHSNMPENYRLIELEPKSDKKFNQVILDKLKRWIIYHEDEAKQEENKEETADVGSQESYKEIKKSVSDSDEDDMQVTLNSHLSLTTTNLNFNLDFDINELALNNTSQESIKRTSPENSEIEKLLFSTIISVRPTPYTISVPPNQLTNHEEMALTNENDRKSAANNSFVPSEVSKIVFKYKFFMDPEEMREYLNLSKPSNADLMAMRHEIEEEKRNPFLKNRDEELEQKMKDDMKNLLQNEVGIERIKTPDSVLKDAKILSNKSLKVLSCYIDEGLSLAVYLGLPDAYITGLGIDSVTSGMSIDEVSYRVMCQWRNNELGSKKTAIKKSMDDPHKYSKVVRRLLQGIQQMKLYPLLKVLNDAISKGVELTYDLMDKDPEVKKLQIRKIDSMEPVTVESKLSEDSKTT